MPGLIAIRVRSIYPYEGQRDVDVTFKQDVVLVAHPAKDKESPWWYGVVIDGGEKGWFPHSYVQEIKGKSFFSHPSFSHISNINRKFCFASYGLINAMYSTKSDSFVYLR